MMGSNSNIPSSLLWPDGTTPIIVDHDEIERLLLAEGVTIFKAPGAKQKLRYTKAHQDFFSRAVSIAANHMAERISLCFGLVEQRIAELEKQVAALGGGLGEKR